jgi:hypothetical protein
LGPIYDIHRRGASPKARVYCAGQVDEIGDEMATTLAGEFFTVQSMLTGGRSLRDQLFRGEQGLAGVGGFAAPFGRTLSVPLPFPARLEFENKGLQQPVRSRSRISQLLIPKVRLASSEVQTSSRPLQLRAQAEQAV